MVLSFLGLGLGEQRSKDQAAAMITEAQQTQLQKAVNEAKTEAERKAIIVSKMIGFAAENEASHKAALRKVYLVTGGVSIVLVIGLLIVWKKRG